MEKQGLRLSARYSKILTAFGVWGPIGAAIVFLIAKQAVCDGLLIVASMALIELIVDGRRMKERVYTNLDLATQWIGLAVPVLSVITLLVALGGSILRPYAGYVLVYLAGQIAILVAASRELRRGVKVA